MFQPWIAPFPDTDSNHLLFSDCGGRITTGFCAVPEVSTAVFQGEGRSGFLLSSQTFGLQTITLPVVWQGISAVTRSWAAAGYGSRSLIEAGIRRFEGTLTGKLVLNPGDGYLYHCVLTGISRAEWLGAAACRKTYTLQGVKVWPKQTVSFSGQLVPVINCTSTLPKTECTLTLTGNTASADSAVVQLGSTVFAVSGENGSLPGGTILLDGIDKKLQVGGENQACIWSWSEFPWLAPGENRLSLTLNGAGVIPEGTLSWYPSFL